MYPIDTLLSRSDRATTAFDISAAKKLKRLVFCCNRSTTQWITMALQTIDSRDLREITVQPNSQNFRYAIHESICREWRDLDRLLVQFWSSHSIRPKVIWHRGAGRGDMRIHAPKLLPELTRRGLVDLVE